MGDRDYINSALGESSRRSSHVLSTSSFLSDADWREALALVRGAGEDLDWSAKSLGMIRRDAFGKAHLLDLIQECERLYEIIRLLGEERDGPQAAAVHLKLAVRAPA
jgi:hypothetical protein